MTKTEPSATGIYSSGDRSTGHYSSGDHSSGDHSSGDHSSGDHSSGDFSSGYKSSGDFSSGLCSTGDFSTGDDSTGDYSTGNRSTGNWSISNFSTGHFSTVDYAGFGAFNKPCTVEKWADAPKPLFLFRISPTRWISENEMTDEEKQGTPSHETTGGYLKTISMQEAWARAWAERGESDLELLKALPNFDADIFEEISGIDINKNICASCGQEKDK